MFKEPHLSQGIQERSTPGLTSSVVNWAEKPLSFNSNVRMLNFGLLAHKDNDIYLKNLIFLDFNTYDFSFKSKLCL